MCIRDSDTVEWYGNGPAETYWDRQPGAKLGIYQNKVADNMAQYLVPQECGAKTLSLIHIYSTSGKACLNM